MRVITRRPKERLLVTCPASLGVWSNFRWQSSDSPLATISANGESRKSKCQIDTLIGLTFRIRGAGRFGRHPHKRNPKPHTATAELPSLTMILAVVLRGIFDGSPAAPPPGLVRISAIVDSPGPVAAGADGLITPHLIHYGSHLINGHSLTP